MDDRARGAGHEQLREWITLEREPGDLLSPGERRRLEEHVAGCSACRGEREAYVRLEALLTENAVPVREGFRDDVMRSLPAAGWEGRAPRAWRLPVAVMLLLGLAGGWIVAGPAAGGAGGAFSGALAALGDMAATGLLAASGLLWASWRGFGLAIDAYLAPGTAIALFVLVVSLDVLLLSILVRRGKPAPEEAGAGGGRDGKLTWRRGKRF
jgi:Putative zinc-finger